MGKRKGDERLSSENLFPLLADRLANTNSTYFCGQEENVAYLLDMLKRTVDKGESNSLLVLGPRGVGKSALVREVMRQAQEEPNWRDNAVPVLLHGHVQTDDRIALRDITKQLGLENVVGNKVFGSFAEHLSFLLASLNTGDSSTSKPIVFILDEFDSFCSHKNQTLLYNLFDVCQSRAVPICVLGISSQIDVTELLEKRVKSRFSHRHLYMWPLVDAKSHLEMAVTLLTLPSDVSNIWNSDIEQLFNTSAVKKLFNGLYNVDKSFSKLKQFLYWAVLFMAKSQSSQLEYNHLETAKASCFLMDASNSLTDQVLDLPILELCILIAIKHLSQIYDNEPFNFEMVYHELVKFKRRKMPSMTEERSVITKSWENLVSLELVQPKGKSTLGDQFSLHQATLPTLPDVLTTALENHPNCPTEVSQWLASSFHVSSH